MSEGTLSENMGFFGNKSSTLRPTALLMQYIKNVSDTLSYLLQFDIFFRCKQVVLRKYRLLLHLLKWSTYGQPYWQSRKASGAFSGLEQPSFCNLLEANIERNFWQDSLLRIFGYIANKKNHYIFLIFKSHENCRNSKVDCFPTKTLATKASMKLRI